MNNRLSAKLTRSLGQVPLVSDALRWYARRYEEGSVVRIARGHAAGLNWKRYHRYVNGYWTGIYELHLQDAFARELKRGNVVYDIGANAGFFTLLSAKLVGPEGRVFAFEPLPENVESVREQIAANSLANCEVVTKAASDYSGEALFELTENNSTAHIAANGAPQNGKGKLRVETVTLDEFASRRPPPDFVKIDVEGAEATVLAGATALLGSPRPPKFLIELHGDDVARRVESTLLLHNYQLADLLGRPLYSGAVGQHHIMAYPPSAKAV